MKKGIIGLFVAFLISFFLLSPKVLTLTNEPRFCSSCHVMHEEYNAWLKGGLHNNIKCIDCHLPNDSKVNFYLWKAIDGGMDLIAFQTGLFPERIQISSHGRKTVQSNCLRCHEGVVSNMLNHESRNCWECHKRISHRLVGLYK